MGDGSSEIVHVTAETVSQVDTVHLPADPGEVRVVPTSVSAES